MSAREPVEIFADGEPRVVGAAGLRCIHCLELIPLPIEVVVRRDADGDPCVFTVPSVLELEAHQLQHLYPKGGTGDADDAAEGEAAGE